MISIFLMINIIIYIKSSNFAIHHYLILEHLLLNSYIK